MEDETWTPPPAERLRVLRSAMGNSPAIEYDLFLDESGTFTETSSVEAERALQSQTAPPSQLAGILARHGTVTKERAQGVLCLVAEICGVPVTNGVVRLHATDVRTGPEYNKVVTLISSECRKHGWQPVRLVNAERVCFGDRVATYTSMLAELVMRIGRRKLIEGEPRIDLHIVAARVLLSGKEAELTFIEEPDYRRRLDEQLAFANIRHGLARECANWRIADLKTGSGKERYDLQLCDWISNASYGNYRRCTDPVGAELRALFGDYNQTLYLREPLERAERYEADGSYGLAILTLAEIAVSKQAPALQTAGSPQLLAKVLDSLTRLGHRARDPQLQVLIDWVEQVVDQHRSLSLGLQATGWLRTQVYEPLALRLGKEREPVLDWFSYALAWWSVTVYNHLGDIHGAQSHANILAQFGSRLAGSAEHSTLLSRGLIARAVHLTDCFEHAEAARMMAKVAGTYEGVMTLLMEELGGSQGPVRSEIKAMALGTWLQAEMYGGLKDPALFDHARILSDKAIAEFTDDMDRSRQFQYRCQIETFAGKLGDAHAYLAKAVSAADDSHEAIANAIKGLVAHGIGAEGFPLLHWMRLGVAEHETPGAPHYDEFIRAFNKDNFEETNWCRGQKAYYPAHGILRLLCRIKVFAGDQNGANRILEALNRLIVQARSVPVVLELIQLATLCEAASGSFSDPHFTTNLFTSDRANNPGIAKILARVKQHAGVGFPTVSALLGLVQKGESDREMHAPDEEIIRKLRWFAHLVGY
ncbi:MAG: hypothetical protein WCN95_02840 [bacterium]